MVRAQATNAKGGSAVLLSFSQSSNSIKDDIVGSDGDFGRDTGPTRRTSQAAANWTLSRLTMLAGLTKIDAGIVRIEPSCTCVARKASQRPLHSEVPK